MARAPNAAGPAPASAQRRALRAWESEGGSLAATPPPPTQPQPARGIEVTVTAQYRVGPYRYTDLACAEAELRRREGLPRV